MITKTDQVKQLVREKKYKKALRIAKGFRIGVTAAERDMMSRAYECLLYPDFYKSIGKEVNDEIEKGINVLIRISE